MTEVFMNTSKIIGISFLISIQINWKMFFMKTKFAIKMANFEIKHSNIIQHKNILIWYLLMNDSKKYNVSMRITNIIDTWKFITPQCQIWTEQLQEVLIGFTEPEGKLR